MDTFTQDAAPEPTEFENDVMPQLPAEHIPTIEKPAEAEKPMSLEAALTKAKAETEAIKDEGDKEEAKADDKKVEAKEEKPKEEKPTRERGEDGKFAAKAKAEAELEPSDEDGGKEQEAAAQSESSSKHEAPSQFLPRAKEAFTKADPDLQGEIIRMRDNYEKGIAEGKEATTFRKELREFEEMAKSAGTTVKGALANYVAIDQQLRTNPMDGVQRVLASIGVTPEQYAQAVMNQKAQDAANPAAAVQRQANAQVQQLQQQLEQERQEKEELRRTNALAEINANIIAPFAVEHPRMHEPQVQELVAKFIESGIVSFDLPEQSRLEEAYNMAVRLIPAGHKEQEERKPSPRAQRPLNPAGSKSVRGNPTAGAFSVANSSKLSLEDSVKKAFADARGSH